MRVRLIKHEPIPKTGSYEIRFPDGGPSRFVYSDDIPGRRLRHDLVDSAVAERVAKIFAEPNSGCLIRNPAMSTYLRAHEILRPMRQHPMGL